MQDNIKIKKHYKNKYTTIDNILINDMDLSFQAKGLFLFLWSKPDDWSVNVKQMQYHCIDKQTKIYSALKELEERGYLIRKRFYLNGKVAGINYNLSDTKDFNEENLNQGNLDEENLNQENQDEYIYIQNKDNTKIKNKDNKENTKKFQKPTLEEIIVYSQERNSDVDCRKFFDYYEAFNWKDAKGNSVKNWKQKFITWEGKRQNNNTNRNGTIGQNNANKVVSYNFDCKDDLDSIIEDNF